MKKLLFIAPFYPPQQYPRAIQISHLVHVLSKDFDIRVLTFEPKTLNRAMDQELLSFTPLNNVIYAHRSFLTRLVEESRGDKFKRSLLPDHFYFEHFDLYVKAKEIVSSFKPDWVFTFGQPMSTHLAGIRLKKIYPFIKWASHFSDPWIDNPFEQYNSWRHFINKRYQDSVFAKSDFLFFTSQETIELARASYPKDVRNKMHVISHIFREDLYPQIPPHRQIKSEKLTIRYLGNFYGKRNPKSFLRALKTLSQKTLDKLQVEFYGECEDDISALIQDLGLHQVVLQKEATPYLESLALMKSADLLLIIDAPFDNSPFLPSKLVDYIGANKPIFGITPLGTSQKLIEEMGFPVAHPNNAEEISRKLEACLNMLPSRDIISIPSKIRNRFSPAVIYNQLSHMLTD